ncbi:MAG: Fic family protein [Vampirovibrionales bacterium]|jgi:Fic family protein
MYGTLKPASELFINLNHESESIAYQYFLPTYLNQGFQITNPDIYLMLEKAWQSITQLNAHSQNVRNSYLFLNMIIKHEAVMSSAMEGTRTTFTEALLPEDSTLNTTQKEDRKEVYNYIKASHQIKSLLEELPISERLICHLHTTLLDSVRGYNKKPGEIRRSQNWIGGASIQTARFVPPHPNELNDLMKDLCEFWSNNALKIPVLIKIALTHYQFETIHPFLDGNGRVGRMLILAQLLDAKVLDQPWLNVSNIFEKQKEHYVASLRSANLTGSLEEWILFFLESIISATKNTYDIYQAFNTLQLECQEAIIGLGAKATNAQRVLEQLYKVPYATTKMVSEHLQVTPHTAKSLLQDLIKLEIVVPHKLHIEGERKQDGVFFKRYADIFADI